MTKEEAWNRIDAIIEKHEVDDVYVTINNHKDYDALRMARKALEQEPILDKIRAEMEQIKEAEYQIYGKDSWRFVDKCLDIIDKYKAESEEVYAESNN